MQLYRSQNALLRVIAMALCAVTLLTAPRLSRAADAAAKPSCPNDDSGLALPAGFCATIFADGIGHARHMAVAANGVVYVNTWSGRYFGNDTPHAGGFLVALQDTTGSGKADINQRFGETVQSGGGRRHRNRHLQRLVVRRTQRQNHQVQVEQDFGVARREIANRGRRVALGRGSSHAPLRDRRRRRLYVDVASATNSCQEKNRTLRSRRAWSLAPSSKREAAFGFTTPTKQIKSSQRRSATRPEYAMPRALGSTRRSAHFRHSAWARSAAYQLAGYHQGS